MIYSNSLANELNALVLDTSVLINLQASRHCGRILDALPNKIVVPEIVASELKKESETTHDNQRVLRDLVTQPKVCLVALDEYECHVFGSLVSGSASLGDGEAATIAIGSCRGYLPIIDERRGRLKAQEYCSGKSSGWSFDILRHPRVLETLGKTDAVDALYFALRDGRMRIHEDQCEYVVSLIGVKRALKCNSLPRYKVRSNEWRMRFGVQALDSDSSELNSSIVP